MAQVGDNCNTWYKWFWSTTHDFGGNFHGGTYFNQCLWIQKSLYVCSQMSTTAFLDILDAVGPDDSEYESSGNQYTASRAELKEVEEEERSCGILYQFDVCWLLGCLTSQQHASVSQGRICSDNFTCCHTEIEVADQTFYLTQSQYTDTGPTSPSADPITPGAWQGSHWSANFEVTGMTRPRKNPGGSGNRTRDLPLSRRTPYH